MVLGRRDGTVRGIIPERRLKAHQKRISELHGITIRPATIEEQAKFVADVKRAIKKKQEKIDRNQQRVDQ